MNTHFFENECFSHQYLLVTSYILAEVESSRGGEYKWGHYMLTIADCRRRIQLEFFWAQCARRESSENSIY